MSRPRSVYGRSKMDGSAVGTVSQHDRRSGRFINGNTEYRRRQQRVAERLEQLCAEYDPSPTQRQLLAVVARNLDDAERGRTAERRVLAANAARRLLRDIPRKEVPVPPLSSYRRKRGVRP